MPTPNKQIEIYPVGKRTRDPIALSGLFCLLVLGGFVGSASYNTVGLKEQRAEGVVIEPNRIWNLTGFFSKDALLEFDKNKNGQIKVEITSGPHKGQVAIARYNRAFVGLGLNDDLEQASTLDKGDRVDISFTQRRITDRLRIDQVRRKPKR